MNDPANSPTLPWPLIALVLLVVGGASVAFFALSNPPKPPIAPTTEPLVIEDVGNWEPFPTSDAGEDAPDSTWKD